MTDIKEMSIKTAKLFHEKYETLAPQYNYETRKETRAFDENSPNGQLMCHVIREVLGDIFAIITELETKVEEGEKAKKTDLEFLQEMSGRLEKAPWDITQHEYLKQMINDWINELKDYQSKGK